jgi:hypothetical protein
VYSLLMRASQVSCAARSDIYPNAAFHPQRTHRTRVYTLCDVDNSSLA